ncbi:ATP-binding protein [Klebsiella pneumoniae]|uniref:ATP-binding protein n=1 Tax=Klebsiella pneumoniae TaxID=573 RepID=UPI0027315E28|nr:ATP-binding protein [Klebsiella pneumoniae]MDP0656851.1 ATP-binding protein [Klebsiella pneumoniae]
MNEDKDLIESTDVLLKKLKESETEVFRTKLRTNERVLARVTDGIYRQPVSALRELASNAFDADASQVFITTDAPRFRTIKVEDNGNGMTLETLVHVIHNIGGSLKRTSTGGDYGITSNDNKDFSPKGRRLIGKIGIGLFSVSQLSQSFQIITKRKGDTFRTVATVALQQYNEVDKIDANENFESGKVNIWKEPASDPNTHGTTIILNNIRAQARETLTDKQFWTNFDLNYQESLSNKNKPPAPKKYYIGRLKPNDETEELLYTLNGDGLYQSLPWKEGTDAENKFLEMTKSVWDELNRSNQRPSIEKLFDHYFYMLWQLALSIPVKYVDSDIFDMTDKDNFFYYKLSNSTTEQAQKINLNKDQSISEYLQLKRTNDSENFKVVVDNIVLKRPIMFQGLPKIKGRIDRPLVFYGAYSQDFGGKPASISAGSLKFYAYLFWNNKIAPIEHRGVLIRVYNSSGTLFDEIFLNYPVQEINRLEQITCEIFVEQGFDSALNIDRESFNYAHPHAVLLTRWLHNALRQLANTQKQLSSIYRTEQKQQSLDIAIDEINEIANKTWDKNNETSLQLPPKIKFLKEEQQSELPLQESRYDYSFDRKILSASAADRLTSNEKRKQLILEEKLKAIATVLISYGIFDLVPIDKRDEMLRAIYDIVRVEGVENA